MKSDQVRVVLLGTGDIGRYHLKLWREVERAAVVGVYDVSAEAAQAAAKEYSVPKVYGSLKEAVADSDANAADICVPNNFHLPVVLAALQAGKHCLCEKPLAVAPREIEQMIAARDSAEKLLMTAQHFRFDGRTAALKKMIDAGRLGEVYYARAWWLRRRMVPGRPGFLSKSQAGGGPCVDIGVHVLDLAMHLLGHPKPVSVTGVAACKLAKRPGLYNVWERYDPKDFEVEDFAAGFVRFESGLCLALEAAWTLNMVENEVRNVSLFGTEGGAQWPDLKFSHEQDGLLVNSAITNVKGDDGHLNELKVFCESIRAGGPSPVPAEQGLTTARILEGLYESGATGREVRL